MADDGGQVKNFYEIAEAARSERSHIFPSSVGDINRLSRQLQLDIRTKKIKFGSVVTDALALASAACERFLNIAPNQVQIAAAYALSLGNIIELPTGEGKTIVATIAAYLHALRDEHVDICTTNDYLAKRDYRWMSLVYGALGITSGLIISGTPREKRREQYGKDVTFAANQEPAFDYLRDHLAYDEKDQVIGHLGLAIIDEADSILIDEARTPLIISEQKTSRVDPRDVADIKMCIDIVRSLSPGKDYDVDYRARSVVLTESGIQSVVKKTEKNVFDADNIALFKYLQSALYVRSFFTLGEDYIIKNGKLELVDEFTGHILPDRKYLDGIQQVLEVYEGLDPTPEDIINASITYRNFFRLYSGIAGMTGTAYTAREEFRTLYNIDVVRFPPYRVLQRVDYTTRFFRTEDEKLSYIADSVSRIRKEGTPLLIVGRSVELAERVSAYLSGKKIEHQLLHAGKEKEESGVISRAGDIGMVTVATNMAGRGADIVIDRILAERSGLHVIGIEHNFSQRVDDQLRGRAGRQGQRGVTEFYASLEDELLQTYGDDVFWNYCEKADWKSEGIYDEKLDGGIARAQDSAEYDENDSRHSLARYDTVLDQFRRVIYEFRDHVLLGEHPLTRIQKEISHILLKEEASKYSEGSLKKILQKEPAADTDRKKIEAFLFDFTPDTYSDVSRSSEIGVRKTILHSIDVLWREFLETIDTLEEAASLPSAAEEDPFVRFINEADAAFHGMRRKLAFECLHAVSASLA